jgi:WD40 repeat protein
MVFSPDGKLVVSGSHDMTIRVWDSMSGGETLAPLRGHDDAVLCVAFSPDGTQIVSGSADLTICLWHSELGMQTLAPLQGHKEPIFSVEFSADGMQVLSACDDGFVRIWDTTSGAVIHQLFTGCRRFVHSVVFSPDGLYIKIAQCNNSVRIWDRSGVCMVKSTKYLHPQCTLSNPIIVTRDAWIVHAMTQTIIGKLPNIASLSDFAASNMSIAFTARGRESKIFIMHFPPTGLTSHGTWNSSAYEEEDSDSDIEIDSADEGEGNFISV